MGSDALLQARIRRERERAVLQFAKDRDLGRLEATMARLDAEAEAAVVRPSRVPTAAEARAYLESLPELWAKTSDAGRHAIAEAVFERIDVLQEPRAWADGLHEHPHGVRAEDQPLRLAIEGETAVEELRSLLAPVAAPVSVRAVGAVAVEG